MSKEFSLADRQHMAKAIQVARKGLYSCHPNPRVGCVLVDAQGDEVAAAAHLIAGEGHAEVNALLMAGERARGATAYVTLEPCSHYGKTGPCALALIDAGVSRVVAAMVDPNPAVAGRGLTLLEQAGVEVESGLMTEEASALNPGFIQRMTKATPWVRLKTASSLDGRTAMASGESQWITSGAARADVQQWRARSSAVLTGVESIVIDDSALTVRTEQLPPHCLEDYTGYQPLGVVFDTHLRTPLTARILKQASQTLIVTCEADEAKHQPYLDAGALVAVFEPEQEQVPLAHVLAYLAEVHQCNEVLVETGATLAASFLEQGLVDEWLMYQATCLLGSNARPLAQLSFDTMSQKLMFDLADVRQFGTDVRFTLKPITT